MTIFSRLRQSFSTKTSRTNLPPSASISRSTFAAYLTTGLPRFGALGYEALTRDGYQRNPVARRAVQMLSDGLASLEITATEHGRASPQHPVLKVLAQPNAAQSGPAFLEALASYLLLHGNAYIELVEDHDGAPAELYLLRPERVTVVASSTGWPASYKYQVAGTVVNFAVDPLTGRSDLLHLKTFNPLDDHYGLGGVDAAAIAIETHNAASQWTLGLLQNAARPSGALVFEPGDGATNLTADQYTRLKGEMADHFQGADNAGRPLLLEGGLKWQPLSMTPADMDFINSRHAAARDIALAFGVPPILLNIPGDATYSNYQEASKALWRATLLPLSTRILASLSGWLHLYWPALELGIDLDSIPALASDRAQVWAQVSAAAFLSNSEKRQLLGLTMLGEDVSDG